MSTSPRPGVLLMTYGSPASLARDDVGAYLARVRGGRPPEPDLVDEFTRRYAIIGGSPLIEITRELAGVMEASLGWPVELGMRFSEPSIPTGLGRLAERGVGVVAGIILSPQFSPLLMGGYARAIDAARAELAEAAPEVVVAGAWHDEPAFTDALARRLSDALAPGRDGERSSTHVLMTAHSLPLRVAEQEPAYLAQLEQTAEAVAAQAGLRPGDWTFCWQSAGHEPGDWMRPDFADLMPGIAAAGGRRVVVAPVQFVADHLETLYDVDVAAREQAERHGLAFERIAALNADPDFAAALAGVARRVLADRAVAAQVA